MSSLCNESLDFALHFVSCFFSWVKREANTMTHALAKFVLDLSSLFVVIKTPSLPPYLPLF
jgi:hypothetical protein